MKCEQIKAILADYEVGGLKPQQRTVVQAHLADCHACRAELRLLQETGALLAHAPPYRPPADLWRRVEREIAQPQPIAWRQRLADFLAPPVRRVALGAGVAVAAAALALVLWLGPLRAPPGDIIASVPDQEGEIYAGYQAAVAWHGAFADRAALGVLLASMTNGVEANTE